MEKLTRTRLLLVDNNADYRHSLRSLLELENYQVEEAASVEEAKKRLDEASFNIVLVDVRLTKDDDDYDISGMEVAKKAQETQTPCIVVTGFPSVDMARYSLSSRGAEPLAVDFVIKKAGPQAILDAIRVVLERTKKIRQDAASNLDVNLIQRLVSFKGEPIDLSNLQYKLIEYLYKRAGVVINHSELIMAIYGEEVPEEVAIVDRGLERLVERTRIKIKDDPVNPHYLVKVKGRGYRLIPNGLESPLNSPE